MQREVFSARSKGWFDFSRKTDGGKLSIRIEGEAVINMEILHVEKLAELTKEKVTACGIVCVRKICMQKVA